jgi:hypothetical protein
VLSDYLDVAYQDYRTFLATRVALAERERMAPANREMYGRILARAGMRYARQVSNLKANARRKVEEEREKLERDVNRARDARWDRLRNLVNKRDSTVARLLSEKVERASMSEVERLFDEGDDWAKSVIAMSIDEPEDAMSDAHGVYERIQRETRDERYEAEVEKLEARARGLKRAEEVVPQLDILGYYAELGEKMDETIHAHALQASNDDFHTEERLKAQRQIDDVWERVAAGVPDDFTE